MCLAWTELTSDLSEETDTDPWKHVDTGHRGEILTGETMSRHCYSHVTMVFNDHMRANVYFLSKCLVC